MNKKIKQYLIFGGVVILLLIAVFYSTILSVVDDAIANNTGCKVIKECQTNTCIEECSIYTDCNVIQFEGKDLMCITDEEIQVKEIISETESVPLDSGIGGGFE